MAERRFWEPGGGRSNRSPSTETMHGVSTMRCDSDYRIVFDKLATRCSGRAHPVETGKGRVRLPCCHNLGSSFNWKDLSLRMIKWESESL